MNTMKQTTIHLIDKLEQGRKLSFDEWLAVFACTKNEKEEIRKRACKTRDAVYGKKVFIRGLIEISNYCARDCFYCGIRRSNHCASRYRLSKDDILACCREGYDLGFRTFVLQGGEDGHFTDRALCDIVSSIKTLYSDCAVTLSVGERSLKSYEALYQAGADRYLLRHETADSGHYSMLHPEGVTLESRKQCLFDLKEIGFQVGCGMMIGSPYQTKEHLAEDMIFLQDFRPHMVGMGPFISHKDTPFCDMKNGSVEDTIFLLSLVRLMLPEVLLPATTALGTLDENGREKAVLAGANVVMPNLSPLAVREKYMLYDNKISTGDEAAESLAHLSSRMSAIGYEIETSRGDHKGFVRK